MFDTSVPEIPQAEEPRARDLLRRGELRAPPTPCRATVTRIASRGWRRPAGNSARLWRKVGEPDPFVAPEEVPKSPHRTVYAAGRFVRIDQAEKAKVPADQKFREAAKAAADEKAKAKAKPKSVHTPSTTRTAKDPLPKKKPEAPPEPVDRTPPMPPKPQPRVSRSGRFIARPQQRSRKPVVTDAPPDRAPPIVPVEHQGRRELFTEGIADPRARNAEEPKPPPAKPPGPPPAKPPPVKPPPAQPAAAEPKPPAKPPASDGGLDDLFAAPKPKPPVPGGKAPTGGLDDLFGAQHEGRVRIGRRTKPKADGGDEKK